MAVHCVTLNCMLTSAPPALVFSHRPVWQAAAAAGRAHPRVGREGPHGRTAAPAVPDAHHGGDPQALGRGGRDQLQGEEPRGTAGPPGGSSDGREAKGVDKSGALMDHCRGVRAVAECGLDLWCGFALTQASVEALTEQMLDDRAHLIKKLEDCLRTGNSLEGR